MNVPTSTPAHETRRFGLAGFVLRMTLYLREMYPPAPRLVLAGLLSTSLLALTARIHDVSFTWIGRPVVVATAGVFLFLLVLRLMDELKDLDIDRALFADRPLPSGRVRIADIVIALTGCSGAFLLVNALSPSAWPVAVAVLGYACLMFRYFFAPELLRRILLLNLLTHNPVVPLLLLWILAVFADQQQMALADLKWRPMSVVLGAYWCTFLAWEIARKIRAPEEETAYVTYSQVLGRRTATLGALGLQTVGFASALHLQGRFGLSWALTATLTAAWAMVTLASARFVWRPSPRTSALRPFAERYILVMFLAVILGVALS